MKIVYKHIPKTAGLSIKKILPDNALFLGHDYYEKIYKYEHLYFHVNNLTSRFVISFVRNPYDRVVSAFYYLNGGGNNKFDTDDYNKYIKKYNGDFTDFVKNAFPNILQQIHFMPQEQWICWNNVSLCNFVGKVETIQDDIIKLSKIINLKTTDLQIENKTNHPNSDECCTHETRKIIQKYYKQDFKLFGYDIMS